jgi:hypothetical protein
VLTVAGFFESVLPVMTCFCHLVIFLSKYILNIVGERGQPWGTPLLISAGFGSAIDPRPLTPGNGFKPYHTDTEMYL